MERAMTLGRAFSRGFLDETGEFGEHTDKANSRNRRFPKQARDSIFVERTHCRTDALRNEQRRQAERFPADSLRKQTNLGNAQTTVPTGLRRLGQPRGTHRDYGSGNSPHLDNTV